MNKITIPDEIKTITSEAEFRIKEKGSEFIAIAFHINSSDEFEQKLISIKKQYYEATHHCYAFRLKSTSGKYSDDGEPSGSAGVRILNAIDHYALSDTAVIVVRYFGGTKLGVGPLGKAYYSAAIEVLKLSSIKQMMAYNVIKIEVPFTHISLVHRQINLVNGIISETQYESEVPVMIVLVPRKSAEIFIERLIDQSNGVISINSEDKILYKEK